MFPRGSSSIRQMFCTNDNLVNLHLFCRQENQYENREGKKRKNANPREMFTLLLPRITPTTTFSTPRRYLTTTPPPPPPPPPPTTSVASLANLVLHSDDAKTLAKSLHDPNLHWTPHLVDKVLKQLWNHGPKALQFFKALETHLTYAHSSSSFDHAIDIAARLRDYHMVWSLVNRMKSRHIGPNPKTFAIIAERYVSAGKPDRAIKVFLSMQDYGCSQDLSSFNSLLDLLCKSKHVEKADNFFRAYRKNFMVDTVSYNIIANGWCLIKRTPKALEVLEDMVKRGFKPSLISYNIMLKGYFRAGQMKEAWEFFGEMKRRGCDIDVVTYTTLVHGFGVVGEVKKARRIFDEMVGVGVLPSVATFNALIQVLCKKDSVENAMVVFEEMMRKGYVPNLTTYTVLIRGLCHAGQMETVMEFMERMKLDECEPNVQIYNVVIRYFCEEGDIEKALSVFEKMGGGSCLPNLDTYNVLISSMFVRKRSDDLLLAGKLLIEMVDRGFVPQRLTFSRILDGLLLTGNQGFAKEILRLQSKCGHLPRHFKL